VAFINALGLPPKAAWRHTSHSGL